MDLADLKRYINVFLVIVFFELFQGVLAITTGYVLSFHRGLIAIVDPHYELFASLRMAGLWLVVTIIYGQFRKKT